jgi:hypothetical protein
MKVSRELLDSMHERGPDLASPALFQNSVHNAAASYISMGMGIKGPCTTVSQGWLSGECAIAQAASYMNAGICRNVLIVGAECFDPEWLRVIDNRPYISRTGLRPMDPGSPGPIWSESCAALVVTQDPGAKGTNATLVLEQAGSADTAEAAYTAGRRVSNGCGTVIPAASGSPGRDILLLEAVNRLFKDRNHVQLPQKHTGSNTVMGIVLTAISAAGILDLDRSGPVLLLGLDISGTTAALRIEI